ncbi:MAG: type II toxin-antitoxin system RelE/ParE family toxin [Flavobacteriales bacterium]
MKVVWADLAIRSLHHTLFFWIEHTLSEKYSNQLLEKIDAAILWIQKFPNSGKLYKKGPIRKIIIDDLSIFYIVDIKNILILLIWDNRQNPNKLNVILEKIKLP